MHRISVFDQATARRAQELGGFGEALAKRILQRAAFTNVRNLNQLRPNFPFGDIYAVRHAKKYVISVKIRNRYEAKTGKLNARYKLGRHCYELARRAQIELSAVPAFLAISLVPDSYSAYFAPLSVLAGGRGIPMGPAWLPRYECLASNAPHGTDVSHLKNTYLQRIDANSSHDA